MSASQKIKLGLLQTWADADPVSNLKRTLQLAHAAADQGAQIISTQELFRSHYFCQNEDHSNFALAEEIPGGPSTQAFRELAKARGVVIVASCTVCPSSISTVPITPHFIFIFFSKCRMR